MPSAQWKTGDVVRLKSGSVNMTVSRTDGDDVHVSWMEDGSKLRHDIFHRDMLMAAPTSAHRGPFTL